MITIYGIPNCDTMKKAMKWLEQHGIAYHFHNYRKEGIEKARLERWVKQLPVDKLINQRGTTWKALTDEEKASISNKVKAVQLMRDHTSVIKRPVWELDGDQYFIGWDEKTLSELLLK